MEGFQWVANAMFTIAAALFGWIANDMKRRIELLESANREGGQDVAVLKSQVMEIKTQQAEFRQEMNTKLDRLLERRQHARE